MRDVSILQLVVMGIFIVATIVVFLIFAGVLPGLQGIRFRASNTEIEFWGITIPGGKPFIQNVITGFTNKNKNVRVVYRYLPRENYIQTVVNAIAAGRGPDIWEIPLEEIMMQLEKIQLIQAKSYPERTFRENFFDGAEVLLLPPDRTIGFPFLNDQLVLYWNRELFRSEAIAAPPKNWVEFVNFNERLTKKDDAGTIIQSGSALGNFKNIAHAKDILALLLLQANNPIVKIRTKTVGKTTAAYLESSIAGNIQEAIPATAATFRFFNQFADPRKTSYAWPPTMPEAQEAFIQGRLAMYFGYGSEMKTIKNKNPHLDFDIAPVPQISATSPQITYGRLTALVISKQSTPDQQLASWLFANHLIQPQIQKEIATQTLTAPVLRALLSKGSTDLIESVLYTSAIRNRFWHDPNPKATREIFNDMVKLTASEQRSINEAITQGNNKMQRLTEQINKILLLVQ